MGKAQEDYEKYSSVAEELGLEDEEAENFVSSAMKRLGHKAKQTWEDADDSNRSSGSDFFSSKRREQRPTRGEKRGGFSQYGT